ncbi:unnamed protein product [Rotaria magnacalcarata]|uniref:Uncharacterized protein n=1 Tax=Rotaria magnacalcarata TaxID=392030 RepID=A0A816NHR6_9BILA|nr:unnamed protein product [Rotaria magnacalcarata]CAF2074834.1 unnamed protein product [Rotaria magnacalcarata]CAF4151289.1 unnamed protein product [Rotaria magnacalcarata]CAF4267342.1 unnamed protein product [Rotaria magnacalcarata]
MEQDSISELEDDLNHIDVESIKLDAIIQLKTWQKRMYALVDKTYKNRLNEIDSIASNIENEIKEKQNQIENLHTVDPNNLHELKHEIELLKSYLIVNESIPENFSQRIERTICILQNGNNTEILDDDDIDDDDEPVIVDIDRHEARAGNHVVMVVAAPQQPTVNHEGTVSKIVNSQSMQRIIAITLAKTLANVGTIAATTTTTAAATTMAKTAIIATACGIGTVAYGVGKIAIGTTKKVWSLVVSSEE